MTVGVREMVGVVGVRETVGVIELSTKVPDFQEEAQQCLHLARAEPEGELRTILAGMALGWLKFADHARAEQEPDIQPSELIAQR
jgi:hypothetical protein